MRQHMHWIVIKSQNCVAAGARVTDCEVGGINLADALQMYKSADFEILKGLEIIRFYVKTDAKNIYEMTRQKVCREFLDLLKKPSKPTRSTLPRISGRALIVKTGTVCLSPMPWESPFVALKFEDGKTYRFASDSITNNGLTARLTVGTVVLVTGFIRDENTLVRCKFPELA